MRFLPTRTLRRSRLSAGESAEDRLAALVALSYELLDAHDDTARLALAEASDADWHSHLAYLRDLQRVGRETLARAAVPSGPFAEPSGR